MPIATRAFAATSSSAPLSPYAFDRRDPGPDDVAIEIKFAGVCHSDLHVVKNDLGNTTYPIVPGHEIAGVVTAVGENVARFKVGDRVGVGCMVDSCRQCKPCLEGEEQYCVPGMTQTYGSPDPKGAAVGQKITQGGYATAIVVDQNYVVTIPDSIPLDAAAPLLCAGITLYSPLNHWKAGPGKQVAILGMGGLGHMGVKIAHAMGAEVTVLSQTLSKREDGLRLGADHYYATNDAETFSKLAGTFDLIICTVGASIDWNQYINLLKDEGSMVIVGIPDGAVPPISAFGLVGARRSLSGSMIGSIKETQEMLDFCGKHNIVSDIEIIRIQDINEAFERVVKSDVRYRFVIDMASL